MDSKLASAKVWRALSQKHEIADNGLLKALTLYEGLGANKFAERTKALAVLIGLAGKLKKVKQVAAVSEAAKYLTNVIGTAEDEHRSLTGEDGFVIADSVGAAGRNNPTDVRAVQKALIKLNDAALPADGKCSKDLVKAIQDYQLQLGLAGAQAEDLQNKVFVERVKKAADGTIKPNSETAGALRKGTKFGGGGIEAQDDWETPVL